MWFGREQLHVLRILTLTHISTTNWPQCFHGDDYPVTCTIVEYTGVSKLLIAMHNYKANPSSPGGFPELALTKGKLLFVLNIMYPNTRTHTHTHTHARTYTRTHICMHTHTHNLRWHLPLDL